MNFQSRLNGAISNTATLITVNSTNGLHATAGGYYLLLDDEISVQELVYVVSRSGYVFSVTRAQGGTIAVSWSNNALIKNIDNGAILAGTGITLAANATTNTTTVTATAGATTLTGDVTGSGTGSFATTIANSAVTLGKMANLAANSIIGNNTGSAATPIALTVAQTNTLLGISGTNTGDQTITLTSDVTGSGTGSFATTIAANAVTLSKMATMATASLLGRNTAGTGIPEVLSASTSKTLLSLNNVENTALSTWAGTANITTLGTVTTGTWNASILGLAYGGTAANITASNGGIVYSTSSALAVLAGTATASKMLLSASSTTPTWSTSTIPTSAGATALKHLKSDGTNYVLTTATISDSPSTAGKILVSDGTNWITSTPTFPNASATSRKIQVSDGTNWVASTETYAVPGTSGNVCTSDGTNWTSTSSGGKDAYTTTATAAGTTTLTSSSNYQQFFTGTTTQTVVMPVASTLTLGYSWIIINNSTGVVTVQSSGTNTIVAMAAATKLTITCILTSGTTAASWDYEYDANASGITGSSSLVRSTSPTLVTPLLGTPTSGVLTNCTGLPVAGGGTGIATTTAYSVICAGTTATGAMQSLAALGASGAVLTSAGAGTLPSFKGGLTAFHASRGTTQSINASTITKVQINTEEFDTGGMFDNATNYRFTPTISGYYHMRASVWFGNIDVGTPATVYLYKNGVNYSSAAVYSPSNGADVGANINDLVLLNGTDYMEMYCYHASAAARSVYATITNFGGVLVEAT